jgi:hypothetical protein
MLVIAAVECSMAGEYQPPKLRALPLSFQTEPSLLVTLTSVMRRSCPRNFGQKVTSSLLP